MKKIIFTKLLIAVLCLIMLITAMPVENAEFLSQTRSEKECQKLEQSELRGVESRQLMHTAGYLLLSFLVHNTLHEFLTYNQHNYQPQLISYIQSSFSIHSPPLERYS